MKQWKKAAAAVMTAAVMMIGTACGRPASSRPAEGDAAPDTVQAQEEQATPPAKNPVPSEAAAETPTPAESIAPAETAAPQEENAAPEQTPEATESPEPTTEPTAAPTAVPTVEPTAKPTTGPTTAPTATPTPTPAVPTPESTPDVPAWETEVAEKEAELERLHKKLKKELKNILIDALNEYEALPVETRGLPDKIRVCLGKAGDLTKMQRETDKTVKGIVGDMRKILKENGQPTKRADEAQAVYDKIKSDLYAELMKQAYSGGDGSMGSVSWLYLEYDDEV